MVGTNLTVKVRIETDIIMDVGLMAKAFAGMDSDKQAQFLKLTYQEMGKYERDGCKLGSMGREAQLIAIGDELKKPENEEAEWMVRELYGFGIEQPEDQVAVKYAIESRYGVKPVQQRLVVSAEVGEQLKLAGADMDQYHVYDHDDDDDDYVYYKGVVMEGFGPMFKSGDFVRCSGFKPEHNGVFKVTENMMTENLRDIRNDHAMREQDAMDIIQTNVEYPPIGHMGDTEMRSSVPKITCKMRLKPGENRYVVNDLVQIDGQRVGRVVLVNPDGTVKVLMDGPGFILKPPTLQDFVDADNPPECDCWALPGVMHSSGCARKLYYRRTAVVYPTDAIKGKGPIVVGNTCDECKGTGFYTGLNESTPCSMGCKPS